MAAARPVGPGNPTWRPRAGSAARPLQYNIQSSRQKKFRYSKIRPDLQFCSSQSGCGDKFSLLCGSGPESGREPTISWPGLRLDNSGLGEMDPSGSREPRGTALQRVIASNVSPGAIHHWTPNTPRHTENHFTVLHASKMTSCRRKLE